MLPCACPARDQIQIWCCSYPSFIVVSVKQDVFARAGSLHQNRLPSGCPRQWVRAGQRRQSRRPLFYGPGDGWIEKIRLDRRRGSFSASAEPYQSDPEGKSAESPERTEIDWRLDITDPTSGRDGPVDNRRHHGALRVALLQAAEQVLERDGLAGLTLRAVARQAAYRTAPRPIISAISPALSASSPRSASASSTPPWRRREPPATCRWRSRWPAPKPMSDMRRPIPACMA